MSKKETPRKFDQHFLQLFYGNEDKSEDSTLLWFKDKKRAADYLRALADKIEEFESSKKYRASDRWLFRELAKEGMEPKDG